MLTDDTFELGRTCRALGDLPRAKKNLEAALRYFNPLERDAELRSAIEHELELTRSGSTALAESIR